MNSALKEVIYAVKGSAPWYNNYDGNSQWTDRDKVTNVDESVSGQAIVTCKDVTNMSFMFFNCHRLTSLDASNFDTSSVIYINDMFYGCSNLDTLDLSKFDTSSATDMRFMFCDCSSLTTIKGIIDMKSCKYYDCMFDNCPKLTGVKIKNPPAGFDGAGLSSSQYTIVS